MYNKQITQEMESAAFTAVIERNSSSDDKANAADPKVMRWRVYNNLYMNVIFMIRRGCVKYS